MSQSGPGSPGLTSKPLIALAVFSFHHVTHVLSSDPLAAIFPILVDPPQTQPSSLFRLFPPGLPMLSVIALDHNTCSLLLATFPSSLLASLLLALPPPPLPALLTQHALHPFPGQLIKPKVTVLAESGTKITPV
eukprot:748710-Hanusia_phi.AAC.2